MRIGCRIRQTTAQSIQSWLVSITTSQCTDKERGLLSPFFFAAVRALPCRFLVTNVKHLQSDAQMQIPTTQVIAKLVRRRSCRRRGAVCDHGQWFVKLFVLAVFRYPKWRSVRLSLRDASSKLSPPWRNGSALTSGWEQSGFEPQRGHLFARTNSSQVTRM